VCGTSTETPHVNTEYAQSEKLESLGSSDGKCLIAAGYTHAFTLVTGTAVESVPQTVARAVYVVRCNVSV